MDGQGGGENVPLPLGSQETTTAEVPETPAAEGPETTAAEAPEAQVEADTVCQPSTPVVAAKERAEAVRSPSTPVHQYNRPVGEPPPAPRRTRTSLLGERPWIPGPRLDYDDGLPRPIDDFWMSPPEAAAPRPNDPAPFQQLRAGPQDTRYQYSGISESPDEDDAEVMLRENQPVVERRIRPPQAQLATARIVNWIRDVNMARQDPLAWVGVPAAIARADAMHGTQALDHSESAGDGIQAADDGAQTPTGHHPRAPGPQAPRRAWEQQAHGPPAWTNAARALREAEEALQSGEEAPTAEEISHLAGLIQTSMWVDSVDEASLEHRVTVVAQPEMQQQAHTAAQEPDSISVAAAAAAERRATEPQQQTIAQQHPQTPPTRPARPDEQPLLFESPRRFAPGEYPRSGPADYQGPRTPPQVRRRLHSGTTLFESPTNIAPGDIAAPADPGLVEGTTLFESPRRPAQGNVWRPAAQWQPRAPPPRPPSPYEEPMIFRFSGSLGPGSASRRASQHSASPRSRTPPPRASRPEDETLPSEAPRSGAVDIPRPADQRPPPRSGPMREIASERPDPAQNRDEEEHPGWI